MHQESSKGLCGPLGRAGLGPTLGCVVSDRGCPTAEPSLLSTPGEAWDLPLQRGRVGVLGVTPGDEMSQRRPCELMRGEHRLWKQAPVTHCAPSDKFLHLSGLFLSNWEPSSSVLSSLGEHSGVCGTGTAGVDIRKCPPPHTRVCVRSPHGPCPW